MKASGLTGIVVTKPVSGAGVVTKTNVPMNVRPVSSCAWAMSHSKPLI